MNNQLPRYNNQTITNHQKSIIKRQRIGYWTLKFGIYLYLVSCLLVIFVLGCARTVTQVEGYGDEMKIEVTLRGTAEITANRYFLVLSRDANYKIPLPPPDIVEDAPEFIEPGMIPQIGSPEAYYNEFYSTWSGYIVLESGGYFISKGPFVIDQVAERVFFSGLGEIGSKITFSFRLDRIFETDIPDSIYFDFVSVPWPDGEEKIPADHLPSIANYISKKSGSILTVDDEADMDLAPGLDIRSCRVEIQ